MQWDVYRVVLPARSPLITIKKMTGIEANTKLFKTSHCACQQRQHEISFTLLYVQKYFVSCTLQCCIRRIVRIQIVSKLSEWKQMTISRKFSGACLSKETIAMILLHIHVLWKINLPGLAYHIASTSGGTNRVWA